MKDVLIEKTFNNFKEENVFIVEKNPLRSKTKFDPKQQKQTQSVMNQISQVYFNQNDPSKERP